MGFGEGLGGSTLYPTPLMGWGLNPISSPIDGSPPVMSGPFWGLPWLCDPIEGGRWPYGVYGASGGLNPISNPFMGWGSNPISSPIDGSPR